MKNDPTLMRTLRQHGFRRTYADDNVCTYEREIAGRKIDVQLWADGNHRVSHMLNGRGTTLPTPFVDLVTMLATILVEVTREHPASFTP